MNCRDNKSLTRQLLEVVAKRWQVKRRPEFSAPDFHDCTGGIRGINGYREHVETCLHCYPDIRVTVKGQLAERDWMAAWFETIGTPQDEGQGIQPTGKRLRLQGVNVDRVRKGRGQSAGGVAGTGRRMLGQEAPAASAGRSRELSRGGAERKSMKAACICVGSFVARIFGAVVMASLLPALGLTGVAGHWFARPKRAILSAFRRSGLSPQCLRGLVALSLVLLAGCETVEKYSLTYRLWNGEDLKKWNEPAPGSRLALFEDAHWADVLVQYDAFAEKHSAIRRQAYYLSPNRERIATGKKPVLVDPALGDALKSIPVFSAPATNQPAAADAAHALTTTNGKRFTLYRPPASPEACELPVFPETSGNVPRIVTTPFAAAGDVVMVGVVAGFVGFLLWLQCGAPIN